MADVLKDAQKLFDQLKAAYDKKKYDEAKKVLAQLKVKLVQLPSLPPASAPSANAEKELQLARDVLEHAVLLALKAHDEGALERAFIQLKTFYADTRSQLGVSPREAMMLGLNLLRLLTQNRIAEFHTELELVPKEDLSNPYVRSALQLEQWLMEGAYNKVLGAGASLPDEFAGYYLDQLTATVRDEIASCSERAYSGLTLGEAQRLMMFKTPKEAAAYAERRGWEVSGERVSFGARRGGGEEGMEVDGAGGGGGAAAAGCGPAAAMQLIQHTLLYAKELERIV
ncbi:26S proteasome non-ATPase regulatory subunit [Raphidocelis subcapitata]|uniref:26S proteasome non-ATPase regulatory subunit n=1 Tax=Raphidocelis subcapitata TaxID=307507 RepID=A0A2V0PBR9_9CHLO|nr:26S proteasome non-ATPase regulatory subunit [Raphidocelis subcapitata]|eukprot:GBF96979.1 26S proteasome non-ATPase regulatory subunit [Raphidocelis subcapitata]